MQLRKTKKKREGKGWRWGGHVASKADECFEEGGFSLAARLARHSQRLLWLTCQSENFVTAKIDSACCAPPFLFLLEFLVFEFPSP
ncbi:hypothetical protein ACFX2A_000204 [Malus domestica]